MSASPYFGINEKGISGKLIIKVRFHDDLRRIPIHNQELTLDELIIMMQRVFKPQLDSVEDLTIKYQDEDGDWVTIHEESDLAYAIQSQPILKLNLILAGQQIPEVKPSSSSPESGDTRDETGSEAHIEILEELRQLKECIGLLADKVDSISIQSNRASAVEIAPKPTETKPESQETGPFPGMLPPQQAPRSEASFGRQEEAASAIPPEQFQGYAPMASMKTMTPPPQSYPKTAVLPPSSNTPPLQPPMNMFPPQVSKPASAFGQPQPIVCMPPSVLPPNQQAARTFCSPPPPQQQQQQQQQQQPPAMTVGGMMFGEPSTQPPSMFGGVPPPPRPPIFGMPTPGSIVGQNPPPMFQPQQTMSKEPMQLGGPPPPAQFQYRGPPPPPQPQPPTQMGWPAGAPLLSPSSLNM